MKHLGSLKSTQEARVALGYASSNSYASLMLSKLQKRMLMYEPIVKYDTCSVLILLIAFILVHLDYVCNMIVSKYFFPCLYHTYEFALFDN